MHNTILRCVLHLWFMRINFYSNSSASNMHIHFQVFSFEQAQPPRLSSVRDDSVLRPLLSCISLNCSSSKCLIGTHNLQECVDTEQAIAEQERTRVTGLGSVGAEAVLHTHLIEGCGINDRIGETATRVFYECTSRHVQHSTCKSLATDVCQLFAHAQMLAHGRVQMHRGMCTHLHTCTCMSPSEILPGKHTHPESCLVWTNRLPDCRGCQCSG